MLFKEEKEFYLQGMTEQEIAEYEQLAAKFKETSNSSFLMGYVMGFGNGKLSTLNKFQTFQKQLDEQLSTNVRDKGGPAAGSKRRVAKSREKGNAGSGNRGGEDKAGH